MNAGEFQFQNGAIKSKFTDANGTIYIVFQFQNGAIKRIDGFITDGTITGFQFQNGAIKSLLSHLLCPLYFDFNSKMVRLKGESTDCYS